MSKRPYLRTDDRRRQLLDAAARLFVRDGYAGLTMVALATEAGVSRRLVYDHFADLPSLYEAFFDDRAGRYIAAIGATVEEADDTASAFAGAFRQLLEMPPEDQRAVRALVTDTGLPDLDPIRERFRAGIEARWLSTIPTTDDGHEPAVLWTLVAGLFGLADLVSRGDVSTEAAMTIATDLVGALLPSMRPTEPATAD